MLNKINFSEVKYAYNSLQFEATGARIEASEDIAEGCLVVINSDGKVEKAGSGDTPLGVNRFPVSEGQVAVVERQGVLKNNSTTSLALTPGSSVYAGANGGVIKTGTNAIGVALEADKFLLTL